MPRPSIRWWYCVQASGNESPVGRDLDARARPQAVRGPQRVGVEAGTVADVPGARASVPEVDGDDSRRGVRALRRSGPSPCAPCTSTRRRRCRSCRARRRASRASCRPSACPRWPGSPSRRCPTTSLVIGLAVPAASRCWRSGRRSTAGSGRNEISSPEPASARGRIPPRPPRGDGLRLERGARNDAVVEPAAPLAIEIRPTASPATRTRGRSRTRGARAGR